MFKSSCDATNLQRREAILLIEVLISGNLYDNHIHIEKDKMNKRVKCMWSTEVVFNVKSLTLITCHSKEFCSAAHKVIKTPSQINRSFQMRAGQVIRTRTQKYDAKFKPRCVFQRLPF